MGMQYPGSLAMCFTSKSYNIRIKEIGVPINEHVGRKEMSAYKRARRKEMSAYKRACR